MPQAEPTAVPGSSSTASVAWPPVYENGIGGEQASNASSCAPSCPPAVPPAVLAAVPPAVPPAVRPAVPPELCVCVCVCVCALRAALLNINLNLAKYNALHFAVYAFWGQFWCSKLGPRIGSFSSPSLGIISPIEVAPYAGALARYGLSGRGRLNKTFSRRARRSRGARSVVRVVSNSWY